MKRSLAAVFLYLLLATPVWAANAQMTDDDKFMYGQVMYYENGRYRDARRIWLPLAKKGVVKAQAMLGVLYEFGQGVRQDYTVAAKWYVKAALQGDTGAQVKVGSLYIRGKGRAKDFVQAYKWSHLAAAHGSAEAAKNRDMVAQLMTPTQTAEAQKLAREWREAFQKRNGK